MLEAEWEFYEKNRDELVEKYCGKYIVISGNKVVSAYDDENVACFETIKTIPLGFFMIHHVTEEEEVFQLTPFLGRMQNELSGIKQELEVITKVIADTVPVEAIYLFGSYAYGTPDKDSDLDLYVVFRDDLPIRELDAIFAIRKAVAPVQSMPLDVIGLKQNRFLDRKIYATLERKIAREGVKLYG